MDSLQPHGTVPASSLADSVLNQAPCTLVVQTDIPLYSRNNPLRFSLRAWTNAETDTELSAHFNR